MQFLTKKSVAWIVVVLVVVVGGYVLFEYVSRVSPRPGANTGRAATDADRSKASPMGTSLRRNPHAEKANAGQAQASGSASRAAKQVVAGSASTVVPAADLLNLDPDSPLAGAALSPAEAAWMNRNGMGAASRPLDPYKKLSVARLEELASSGDPYAAMVGSMKTRTAAWNTPEGQSEQDLVAKSGNKPYVQLGKDEQARRHAASKALFATKPWQQSRDFLWHGVVHGSAIAALGMAGTYRGPLGTCFEAGQCNAWALVAWRMGAWQASFSWQTPAGIGHGTPILQANLLWAKINAARRELGLAPLQLDLRPNFSEWFQLRRDAGQGVPGRVPVYPR